MRVLDIAYPFHSRMIERAREPLLKALAGLRSSATAIPFVSTVTGDVLAGERLDAGYWWRNVRAPVQFRDAVAAAVRTGARLFVEIGPRPVLQSYLGDSLAEAGEACAAIATLGRDDADGLDPVRVIHAKLLARGVRDARVDTRPMRPVALPAYPWQRQVFRPAETTEAVGHLRGKAGHSTLLGWQPIAGDLSWRTYLDAETLPWLADHRVNGRIVFPGAGFAEMALAATRAWLGTDAVDIRDMDLVHPLVLEDGQTREVRIQVMADTGAIDIASRPRLSDGAFETHARCHGAKLAAADSVGGETATRGKRVADAGEVYAAARRHGLDYGPAFRRVAELRRIAAAVFEVTFAARAGDGAGAAFGLDPADLDAAFHGQFVLSKTSGAARRDPFVPTRFGHLRLYRPGAAVARARLDVGRANSRSIQTDVMLLDADGHVIAALTDARFAAAPLFQTWRLEDVTYHEALVPLRMDGGAHERQSDFAALCAVAETEAAAADDANLAEPHLLLEAAARQVAREALEGAAPDDGGDVLLRAALEANGWSGEDGATLPPAADILRTIVAQHPAWSADCTLLAGAAAELKQRLAATGADRPAPYSAATRDHFQFASPRHAWAAPAVAALVKEAGAERVAVLGGDDRLVRLLAAGDAQIVVAENDHRALNWIRIDFERVPQVTVIEADGTAGWLSAHGPFDAIVSTGLHRLKANAALLDTAAAALKPGAPLILAAAHPDAFHDVVFGLDAGWFSRSVDADFPMGALRTIEDWKGELAAAGFVQRHVVAVGGEEPLGLLAVARACAGLAHVNGSRHGETAHKTVVRVIGGATAEMAALQTRLQARLGFAPAWTNGHASSDGHDADAAGDTVALIGEGIGLQDAVEGLTHAVTMAAAGASRLWFVCRADVPVMAAIRGTMRTAANEYADLDMRLVEIDGRLEAEDAADRLADIVRAPPEDREIVIAARGISARRVRRGSKPAREGRAQQRKAAGACSARAGAGSSIRWRGG